MAVAAGIRLGLIVLGWPATNSDEGTIGIMALHIATGKDFPNFYYGQSYLGSGQAYLAAVLFKVFGPSVEAVRFGMLLLYLSFLVTLYALARALYSTGVALASVGLLALGSRELYGSELVAIGGLPETLLAGTGLLLLAYRVVTDPVRKRWFLAGWGLVAALGLWSNALVAPFVAGSALLLWRARPLPKRALVAGLTIGAIPFILHDLTSPIRHSSLATFVRLYASGGTGQAHDDSGGLVQQVANTIGTSLAYATGGSALAHHGDPPAWPSGWAGGWHPQAGSLMDALWGMALVGLWCLAVARAVRTRRDPRSLGRLALLVSAGLTVAAFAASKAPGLSPANHSRYLIGVLVATPAFIYPLWTGRRRLAVLLALVVLASGTADAYRAAARATDGTESLGRALLDRGVTRVYADYWTCNRLAFASQERVVCAVVDAHPDGLHHGLDRYLPYRAQVRADPDAAYLVLDGPPRVAGCTWHLPWNAGGYQVWQSTNHCVPMPDPHMGSRF